MSKNREHPSAAHASSAPTPEFSRKVGLHEVQDRPIRLDLEASFEERAALCLRFDLEALDALEARLSFERLDRRGLYRLEGSLRAAVTQLCVVSVEPVETAVEGPFVVTFIEAEDADASATEEVDLGEDLDQDPPEPYSGDFIDVGEAVVQQFATMLDPYPRLAGARIDPSLAGEAADPKPSPFAGLAGLKASREPGAD